MTDQPGPSQGSFFHPEAPPNPPVFSSGDNRTIPLIVYILYLAPLGGITHLVGLVVAYVARDTAPDWLRSHYTHLIRTFWIGLLYAVVTGFLCLIVVGFFLIPVVVIWFIIRCALGIARLMQRQPCPNPESWLL